MTKMYVTILVGLVVVTLFVGVSNAEETQDDLSTCVQILSEETEMMTTNYINEDPNFISTRFHVLPIYFCGISWRESGGTEHSIFSMYDIDELRRYTQKDWGNFTAMGNGNFHYWINGTKDQAILQLDTMIRQGTCPSIPDWGSTPTFCTVLITSVPYFEGVFGVEKNHAGACYAKPNRAGEMYPYLAIPSTISSFWSDQGRYFYRGVGELLQIVEHETGHLLGLKDGGCNYWRCIMKGWAPAGGDNRNIWLIEPVYEVPLCQLHAFYIYGYFDDGRMNVLDLIRVAGHCGQIRDAISSYALTCRTVMDAVDIQRDQSIDILDILVVTAFLGRLHYYCRGGI